MLVEHNLSQQQQRLTGVNFQQTRLCVRRVVQADFVNSALGRNAAPFQYCVKRLAQIRLQQVAVRQRKLFVSSITGTPSAVRTRSISTTRSSGSSSSRWVRSSAWDSCA